MLSSPGSPVFLELPCPLLHPIRTSPVYSCPSFPPAQLVHPCSRAAAFTRIRPWKRPMVHTADDGVLWQMYTYPDQASIVLFSRPYDIDHMQTLLDWLRLGLEPLTTSDMVPTDGSSAQCSRSTAHSELIRTSFPDIDTASIPLPP
ncbi:hypothetical protein EW146_g10295 [Bondarzewia mesenterica]|uniref:Uncharacterized protein n=1 Tax=Bondarzewia mesenterica TaxID=1095465 RepID=A0A4S4L3D1_9AGAM|nr:hypothetical protein EW146_g10295 [Bondarzewia mesenterica]